MTIVLNGEPHEAPAECSVAGLVAALGLEPRTVAVERNEEIVPRARWGETPLAAGDRVEIVHFVGGG